MADIARLAGVHQTTVSRALRNDLRLPIATRERIQAVAEKAGYRPNPLVSALVTLRRSRLPAPYQATLAYIVDLALGPSGEHHFEGARATAETLGFKLDLFVLGRDRLTATRLDEVLLARGIHGLVIGALPSAHQGFQLTWERYSTVVIEYTFDTPEFDRVVHDSYAGMRQIMHECRHRRLRRVGITLSTTGDERTEHLNLAAYWVEQKADRFFAPITPLIVPEWDARTFDRWFRDEQPEVIVTSNSLLPDLQAWCRRRRLQTPRDLQVINVNALAGDTVSGINQNHAAMGAAALRLTVDKLNRNDRGIPPVRHTVLTPGTWFEGTTLQPAAGGAGAARPVTSPASSR